MGFKVVFGLVVLLSGVDGEIFVVVVGLGLDKVCEWF